MLKKFMPAFMLMVTVTLAFAFTPAKHQQKTLAETFYTYNGTFQPSGDPLDCEGQEVLCGIQFDNTISPAATSAALNYAPSNYESATSSVVNVPYGSNQTIPVTVFLKAEQGK